MLTTLVIVGGFGVGIVMVNTVLPTGFIPLEDQGMIYGIIQTPPGSTLEYTNAKSHELQAICQEIDEMSSVSSLAGYEVLTEGRGSNAGTCLINLKPWAEAEDDLQGRSLKNSKKEGAPNRQREARVLRASRGARLRCGRRLLGALNLLDKTNSDGTTRKWARSPTSSWRPRRSARK